MGFGSIAYNSICCGGMVFFRWATLDTLIVHLFLLLACKCPWVLDWETKRSWIAILELDFLCLKEIRIWKSPPMSTRDNFITIAGFKICQANRVHYLDSLDFMVQGKISFLQSAGVLMFNLGIVYLSFIFHHIILHLVPITFRCLAFSLLGCFIFYDICFFTSLGFANRDIGEASRLLDQI